MEAAGGSEDETERVSKTQTLNINNSKNGKSDVNLGVGQPQPSHAVTAAARLAVDSAELLFDGAEIGHEGIEVYILALVKCLYRHEGSGKLCKTTTEEEDVLL